MDDDDGGGIKIFAAPSNCSWLSIPTRSCTSVDLKILVSDNKRRLRKCLAKQDAEEVEALCERCACVMKQQHLSASSFLARFFNEEILSAHEINHLGKSGKGSAPVLAQRITREWAKNSLVSKSDEATSCTADVSSRKRKAKSSRDSSDAETKKK